MHWRVGKIFGEGGKELRLGIRVNYLGLEFEQWRIERRLGEFWTILL